jgi:1-acyl-sn-glycerol-3-phosphate acyltransferase
VRLWPLRAAVTALVVTVASLVLSVVACLAALLRLPSDGRSRLMRACARLVLFVADVKPFLVYPEGTWQRLPRGLVVVANHESLLDTPSLLVALRARPLRFVFKREMMWIPIFGWALPALGHVPVTRHRGAAGAQRLNRFRGDTDLVFFAEGTRSREGKLLPLKKGAFAYAILHDRPILPVAVVGGHECLPSHSLRLSPGHVAVVVGEPIDTTGLTLEDREALRDRTAAALARLRAQALAALGRERPADRAI